MNDADATSCEACNMELRAQSPKRRGDALFVGTAASVPKSLRRVSLQEVLVVDRLPCVDDFNAASSIGSSVQSFGNFTINQPTADNNKDGKCTHGAQCDDQVSTSSEMHNDVLNEDSETDDDSCYESEYEVISGTLEVSPPVGTRVKSLHEDDMWWPGRIIEASGSTATIAHDNGDMEMIDLTTYAVRLLDYSSDDEEEDDGVKQEAYAVPSSNSPEDEQPMSESSTKCQEADEFVAKHSNPRQCREAGGDSEYDTSESEYEIIPGTLDDAPAVGTQVKVLHEDDKWWPAQVVAARGSICKILYETGASEEIDVEVFAVRLLDYVDEDEQGRDKLQEQSQDEWRRGGLRPEDDEIECEEIAGTLDVSPPFGTNVKVLHDDGRWWHACVTVPEGTKAKVLYESGCVDEVDLEVNLVCLAD